MVATLGEYVIVDPSFRRLIARNLRLVQLWTNRYRRAVRVKDGGLEYSGDRERGTLTLHEAEGRRMLTGRISQIDGPPYAIYLEAQRTTSAAPSPAESGAGDLTGHGRPS